MHRPPDKRRAEPESSTLQILAADQAAQIGASLHEGCALECEYCVWPTCPIVVFDLIVTKVLVEMRQEMAA